MNATNGTANGHHRNGLEPGARKPAPANPFRRPPQNLEAERGVLCSILLDNGRLHDVAAILKPEDFFRDSHATLYREILALYDAGRPVDAVILTEALGERLGEVGGLEYLGGITNAVPSPANAAYFAQIVRQKAMLRSVIDTATGLLEDAYGNATTVDQVIEAAERKILAIGEADAGGNSLDVSDVIAQTMDRVGARERGEVTGISSGFVDLDDLTDGLQAESLIIVAARPSQGKSALAMNIADHVATAIDGAPVLFVSLEMNRLEIGERLLSSWAKIDSYKLKDPAKLNPREVQLLGGAVDSLRQSRMIIDDTPFRTVTQIAANARRIKARRGLGLVIVDYIQLIDGQRGKGESRQEEVARISKRLKTLARELHVPVIALAQLNRQSEQREDRRPRLADLRESGQIEADADVVMLIHRPEYYDPNDMPGIAEVNVAKNRCGATGTVRMVFLKHCTRFETLARVADAPPPHGF